LRRQAIKGFLNRAYQAFEYQELSTLLSAFFLEALKDPENDQLLGAPPGYQGKISSDRKKLFQIQHSWFRDYAQQFSSLRKDFEAHAAIYTWLQPEDLGSL
jgi:hypothetical protein